MANVDSIKSTIVRAKLRSMRIAFWLTERFVPRLGARMAAWMWFKLPPAPARSAVPDGASAFSVESMGHTVRGLSWGTGPVVYALHGWGGRGDQFAAFVAPLVSAGYRVVVFDALSHGASDDGPSGRGRAHGVEFGRALDDVAVKFGPAHAVIAHSMGAISSLLALRDGWLGAERLVMIAPMVDLTGHFDRFGATVGFGHRIRHHLNASTKARTGVAVEGFSFDRIAEDLHPLPPTLFIHDRRDREAPHDMSARVVEHLPSAEIVSTDGLGHRRILQDPGVVAATVAHLRGVAAESDDARSEAEPEERADAIA